MSIRGVPSTLVRMAEEADVLGSCDWGECDGAQVGWAHSNVDADDEWLAICAECLARGADGEGRYPVAESWRFEQIEEALGWSVGAIAEAAEAPGES